MYIVLAFNLGFYCTHWKNTFIRSADKKIKRIRQDHNLLYRFISALPARVIRWIDLTRSNSEVLILYSKKSKNSVHYCSLLGLTFQPVSCNMTNRMTNRIKYLFASLSLKGLTLSLMYENKFTYWIKYFLSIFWFFLYTDAAAFIVSKVSLKFQLNETVDRLDKAACACSYCL